MRRDTINYFYVGLAVLAALVLLILSLLKITGRGGSTDAYVVRYQNVAGLSYGSAVLYQGYRIGQIEAITPEQKAGKTLFRVDFSVTRGWQIPKDSVAAMVSSGLLSDVFVGISEGKTSDMLAPGAELTGRENADMFVAVGALAGEITELTQSKISPLLEKVGLTVDALSGKLEAGGPMIVDDAVKLIKQLNQGADALNEVLGARNRGNIEAMLASSAGAATDAKRLTNDLLGTRKQLADVLEKMDGTMKTIGPDAQASMDDLRATLATLAQRVDAITYNLESASRHFDEFGRELRKQPNRLLFNPNQDDDVRGNRR